MSKSLTGLGSTSRIHPRRTTSAAPRQTGTKNRDCSSALSPVSDGRKRPAMISVRRPGGSRLFAARLGERVPPPGRDQPVELRRCDEGTDHPIGHPLRAGIEEMDRINEMNVVAWNAIFLRDEECPGLPRRAPDGPVVGIPAVEESLHGDVRSVVQARSASLQLDPGWLLPTDPMSERRDGANRSHFVCRSKKLLESPLESPGQRIGIELELPARPPLPHAFLHEQILL